MFHVLNIPYLEIQIIENQNYKSCQTSDSYNCLKCMFYLIKDASNSALELFAQLNARTSQIPFTLNSIIWSYGVIARQARIPTSSIFLPSVFTYALYKLSLKLFFF